MALLNDILGWSTTNLLQWQQDALRRLFQKQALDLQDYDDLYALLKANHGITDAEGRVPIPLSAEHLPVGTESASFAILHAMRDIKYVNRIANGQKITFSPKGVTVIYGHNGSGKSGYSRVLKRACRSRDGDETIHPNAFKPEDADCIPEAILEVVVGQEAKVLVWKQNEISPEILSTISVFDGKCARVYTDSENDAAFIPYGLDIVENLAKVLGALDGQVKKHLESINIDKTPFNDLLGDTKVGKLIANLSERTSPEQITLLGALHDKEKARLAELINLLSEGDPSTKARELQLKLQRITAFTTQMEHSINSVSDLLVASLKKSDEDLQSAIQAEAVAARAFRAGEDLLPGTGEQAWKILFEAARKYSLEGAYSDKPFPYTGTDARCPLCQQGIGEDAGKRLKRFEDYLKQDAAKLVFVNKRKHDATIEDYRAKFASFEPTSTVVKELEALDSQLPDQIKGAFFNVGRRKELIDSSIASHNWDDPMPAIDQGILQKIRTVANGIKAQVENLQKAANAEQRKLILQEREELHTRDVLSKRLQSVVDLHGHMRDKAKLNGCREDLKTKPISDKAREFSKQAVTKALEEALNSEYQQLGVGSHIRIKLTDKVVLGKTKHKLILDLPTAKNLNEILSDGEQRVIAIGAFLAELRLAGHKGAIVFDDPVSSLDHNWRKSVAVRLVKEAVDRQIVVFTHDTVFLAELRSAIEELKTEHIIHFLEWRGDYAGYVEEGLPWDQKSFLDRIDRHEKGQRALEKIWPAYPGEAEKEKMRREYSQLRATIERAIQDVVLNGVVERYIDYVKVGRLGKVVGLTADECSEINRLHKICCEVTDAHDPAPGKAAPLPTPAELKKNIADLRAVIDGIKSRK